MATLEFSVPLLVFNGVEARAVDAIASRIFPADDGGGGAHEAEVVVYIDRTLAGHSRHLQTFYRDSLRALDAHCVTRFGARFADLAESDQNAVLEELDTDDAAFGELGRLPPSDASRELDEGAA